MAFTLAASLPQQVYEAKQVQQNEVKVAAAQKIPMYQLMEKAGEMLFLWVKNAISLSQPLIIFCGKGNNGGDGYIVARLAYLAGYKVQVVVLTQQVNIQGDAQKALTALQQTACSIDFILPSAAHSYFKNYAKKSTHKTSLVVDALFGIGFKGELSADFVTLFEVINQAKLQVLSVDIPSGLCGDTGTVKPTAIKAHTTISFIAMKQGLLTGKAANFVGKLLLADLDLGEQFQQEIPTLTYVQTYANLPKVLPREPASHKGSIGLVLAVGGNKGFPGAIRLSAEAALRTGASLVSVACHEASQRYVLDGRPEIMLAPTQINIQGLSELCIKAKVMVLGPGLGQDAWAKSWFEYMIKQEKPLVIDADALRLLSVTQQFNSEWVLTPHPGEAAALLHCDIKTIEADRFYAVKAIAQKYGGICVLKGAGSLVSDGQQIWVNTSGNAGMASGGMGDVLSGVIAALLLQMSDNLQATRLAVYIHAYAADILAQKEGERGLLASDLLPEIRLLLNDLINQA